MLWPSEPNLLSKFATILRHIHPLTRLTSTCQKQRWPRCFIPKTNSKVCLSIGMHHFSLHAVVSTFDTGTGLNLVDRSFFSPSWRDHIRTTGKLCVEQAWNRLIHIEGIIKLVVRLVDLQARATFEVVHDFIVPILLLMSCIHRIIAETFPFERRTILVHSPPVAILAHYTSDKTTNAMATSYAKNDYNDVQSTKNGSWRTDNCSVSERAFWKCAIPPFRESLFLVLSSAIGLNTLDGHLNVTKNHTALMARGGLEVIQNKKLCTSVLNVSPWLMQIPKMYVTIVSTPLDNLMQLEYVSTSKTPKEKKWKDGNESRSSKNRQCRTDRQSKCDIQVESQKFAK